MYKPSIPKEQLADLFRLREFAAQGSIAGQVRRAISNYLKAQEKKIGCSISDLAEAIERHGYEQACDEPQFETLPDVPGED